jgi:hypothetical protein
VIDLRQFVLNVKAILESHNLGTPGAYKRWLFQNESGNRNMGIDVYGCSDAANILYTIGDLPCSQDERSSWISTLQSFQNKDTGLFSDKDISTIHTCAFSVGALELFEAKPLYPMYGLKEFATKENLYGLLDGLDWVNDSWRSSHKGAGIYAAMVLTGSVPLEWEDWYFQWLWDNADSETGLWKKDCILDENGKEKGAPFFHFLATAFHYVFNCEYAKRQIRFPEKIVDSCIKAYNENLYPPLSKSITYNEIDFIYLLSHCMRRTGHRIEEGNKIISEIAKPFINYILGLDVNKDDGINDLHNLFAVICSLAIVQDSLPGFLKTEKPLRMILDRRPFL